MSVSQVCEYYIESIGGGASYDRSASLLKPPNNPTDLSDLFLHLGYWNIDVQSTEFISSATHTSHHNLYLCLWTLWFTAKARSGHFGRVAPNVFLRSLGIRSCYVPDRAALLTKDSRNLANLSHLSFKALILQSFSSHISWKLTAFV